MQRTSFFPSTCQFRKSRETSADHSIDIYLMQNQKKLKKQMITSSFVYFMKLVTTAIRDEVRGVHVDVAFSEPQRAVYESFFFSILLLSWYKKNVRSYHLQKRWVSITRQQISMTDHDHSQNERYQFLDSASYRCDN